MEVPNVLNQSTLIESSLERMVRKGPFESVGDVHKEWAEAGVAVLRAITQRLVLNCFM